MRAVLGQELKEAAIFNSSDFGLIPLDITNFVQPDVLQYIGNQRALKKLQIM